MRNRGLLSHVSGQEIVGGEEIVGTSRLQSIIGALTPQEQNELTQLALTRQAGGVGLMQTPDSFKVKALGFTPQLAVAADATVTCETPSVQEKFRPERLIIGPVPASWVITAIEVTTKRQTVTTGPLPGTMFAHDAWGVYLEFTTLPIGGEATITATNISAAAANLYAGFLGSSLG